MPTTTANLSPDAAPYIRRATEDDLPEILALYTLAGITSDVAFTLAEAKQHFAHLESYPDYKIYVAQQKDTLVGTYELLIMDNLAKKGARGAIVEDVAVHPMYQGQGIGRQMMQHAMHMARQRQCYKLVLSSNLKRQDAHRFYEKLGFVQHGLSFRIDI